MRSDEDRATDRKAWWVLFGLGLLLASVTFLPPVVGWVFGALAFLGCVERAKR